MMYIILLNEMNEVRWNLEFQINLICLDEATRTRADDQNPERSKKSSFLVDQIQSFESFKPAGHSFRYILPRSKICGVWTTILEKCGK